MSLLDDISEFPHRHPLAFSLGIMCPVYVIVLALGLRSPHSPPITLKDIVILTIHFSVMTAALWFCYGPLYRWVGTSLSYLGSKLSQLFQRKHASHP